MVEKMKFKLYSKVSTRMESMDAGNSGTIALPPTRNKEVHYKLT